ncbi:hypothetical protein Lal_00030137 [Lupinus albus]|nr:hypothetical protein Lal_00030137 [Lupinus albus]
MWWDEKRDPKVGGGVGRIREVVKNRTPILTKCNKCGRLHYGSTCPGKGNGYFHCKEFGHIKRYCPKLDRRPNVMHAGEARDHGRMVTPSGAGTSGVDDPARGKRMVTESGCGKSADRVVAVGDLCKVSDQASGIGPMSAKKVRTLLRKRDRYSFSKCHKRNIYHSVDMRNDVLAGFNPGNGLAGIDYDFGGVSLCLRFRDSRLSERGASGRVKSWAILEDSRLSESCITRARNGNFGQCNRLHSPWLELEEKIEKGAFQEQGALGLILELAKRLHYGSTCPGKGNGYFHYKEFGHIKRYCPKLDRRPNVMHAGEARDHGRMVTPSGAGTSGVNDPARGKRMVTESGCGKSADRVVAVGDLCKVSDQASGIGPMSAKKVRTLLRKRDRYSFSKCHKRNIYHSVDMRNDVLAGFNPGNGLAGIDYDFGGVSLCLRFRDSRLSERGASGRVKSWAILEDSRLSESWLELEEKIEKGAFQEQGALGLILELAKSDFGSSYVATLWLKLCSNALAQVMKQYFGSSYVAMLWLKLCSNTLAQVMKQYFGSSYVAMLWLKLCSKTLAQVM